MTVEACEGIRVIQPVPEGHEDDERQQCARTPDPEIRNSVPYGVLRLRWIE
jgi:hypothetical protein